MVNPVVTRTETSGEVSLKTPLLFAETSMGMNVGGRSSRFLRILTGVAMRCWAIAGAAVLTCLLLYWAYGGLLAFMLLCFATTGILYHTEDNLLFHPELPAHSRVFVPVPSMFGLPYENIFVHSGDGTMLHLFYIRQQPANVAANAPTIIFLHGNAGNMGHRLQNTLGLYQNLQCNILMLEYRGYGLSQGSPSEEGLCMDARAALDYLASRQDVNHKEIILFGRSLGGAVAIDVASRPEYSSKIWCVVLENTFTSIPDMAKVLIGWRLVNYLPLCFYKNKFLSASKISCLERPTLFISGLADTLVPPRMMTELHRCCSSHHKQLLQFESGTHNETWTISGYYHAFANFLRDVRMRSTLPESPPSQVKPV
ncbi:protein ABHD13 [Anabrus simplex]|uniref:protein ABHD13 n=1 Tax=Anabrus simplex TaxID=316456 RepID=UPI0034DDB236